MAKGDKNEIKDTIYGEQGRMNEQRDQYGNQLQGFVTQFNDQGLALSNEALKNYNLASQGFQGLAGSANSYGLTEQDIANLWYGGGASGGIDNSIIDNMGAEAYGGFQGLSGGLDSVNPAFMQAFNQDLSNVPTEQLKGWMENGAITDPERQAMRLRASSTGQGIAQNATDEVNRNRGLQGGYSPNTNAALAKIGREASYATNKANIDTEGSLAQLTQQGRLSASNQLSNASISSAQARTQVEQIDAQLRIAGLSGMTDIEKARLAGQLQNAQINMQASATNAGLQAGKAMLQTQLTQQAKQFGGTMGLQANQGLLSAGNGITSLYGTPNSNLQGILQLLSGNINGQQTGNLGLIQALMGNAGIGSNAQNAMANAGTGMGLAGQAGNLLNQFGQGNQGGTQFGTGNGQFTDPSTIGQGNGWVYGNQYIDENGNLQNALPSNDLGGYNPGLYDTSGMGGNWGGIWEGPGQYGSTDGVALDPNQNYSGGYNEGSSFRDPYSGGWIQVDSNGNQIGSSNQGDPNAPNPMYPSDWENDWWF